jgi:hypothetical protein
LIEEERSVQIVENYEVEERQNVDNRRRSTMNGFVIRLDRGADAKKKTKANHHEYNDKN